MTLQQILTVLLGLVALKAVLLGSSFDFLKWYKHGKKYSDWYFDPQRQRFEPPKGDD